MSKFTQEEYLEVLNPQTNLADSPQSKETAVFTEDDYKSVINNKFTSWSGLDTRPYDSMNFTNIYRDDISRYTKYDVPTTRFFNWDETRAQNQGVGEKWVNGIAKAGVTTLGAVAENTLGVLAGLGEVFFGSGRYYDNVIGKTIDKKNNWMRENMPNYRSEAELEASTWQKLGTANFWADTVANGLGYSIGSIATFYLTGGVGLGTYLGTKMLTRLGKTALASSIYNTSKAISTGTQLTKEVGKRGKFLKMPITKQGLINASNTVEIGLMMSLAESSVEARENQKNTFDDLVALELERKGLTNPSQLSDMDLKGIEDASYASANRHFLTQLPVLAGSNLLMFGRSLAGFKATRKINKDVQFDKALGKAVNNLENRSIFRNTLSRLKPAAKGSAIEAFQEGWQFASGVYSSDYHTDKYYDGGMEDLTASMYKGITETFGTQEGLESMLVGAIVGGGMAGVRSTARGEFDARKNAATYATDVLNSGYLTIPQNQLEDVNAQIKISRDLENARQAGDIKAFKDAQFKLIQYNALAAIKNGTFEVFKERLEDAKTLNDLEFAKVFGFDTEQSIEEQTKSVDNPNGQSKSELVNKFIKKLNKFEKSYDKINERFPEVPKTFGLPRMLMSEEQRNAEDIVYNKRQRLRDELILDASSITNRNDRLKSIQKQMQDVLGEASKINGVPMIDEDFNLYHILNTQQPEDKKGGYDREEQVNIILKSLNDIQNKLVQQGATAEVKDFNDLAKDYVEIFQDNAMAIDRYNNLSSSKFFQDMFDEAVKQNQEEARQKAKDKKEQENVDTAATAQEARESVSEESSPNIKRQADLKENELKEREKEAELKYLKMNPNKTLKEKIKALKSMPTEELTDRSDRAGLLSAIKILENKLEKGNTEQVVSELDLSNTIESENNIRVQENNEEILKKKTGGVKIPKKEKVSPAVPSTDKSPASGQLAITSAPNRTEVIRDENGKYKVPVDEQGIPKDTDPDTIDNNIIPIKPDLLLDEDILKKDIELEIVENDWWKTGEGRRFDQEWMEIPIYYKIGDAYLGKLIASSHPDRKALVDKLQKGDKVITKISEITANNFNNSVDSETTEIFFHDPTKTFGEANEINDNILIGFTTEVMDDYHWNLGEVNPDKNKNNELRAIKIQVEKDATASSINQIGIVIKKENNPEGIARMSIATTAYLNALAQEAVLKALSDKKYSNAKEIVSNSNVTIDNNERKTSLNNRSYLEFGEFKNGDQYIVYFSPKLKKLIRINENELKKALDNTGESSFSVVNLKKNEFTGPKLNTKQSGINIKEDLTTFLANKKYNIDKNLANKKLEYLSKVTNEIYPTYQHYLFSSTELGNEPREQGLGHNSILSTDIVKKGESMFNSPKVTFEKGNILGETAPEIIKNTKMAKTSPEAPAAPVDTQIKQVTLKELRELAKKTEGLSENTEDYFYIDDTFNKKNNKGIQVKKGRFVFDMTVDRKGEIEPWKVSDLREDKSLYYKETVDGAGRIQKSSPDFSITEAEKVLAEIQNLAKPIIALESPAAKKKTFKRGSKSKGIIDKLGKKCD